MYELNLNYKTEGETFYYTDVFLSLQEDGLFFHITGRFLYEEDDFSSNPRIKLGQGIHRNIRDINTWIELSYEPSIDGDMFPDSSIICVAHHVQAKSKTLGFRYKYIELRYDDRGDIIANFVNPQNWFLSDK